MPSLSIYSFILLNEHTAVIQCFPSHQPSFSLLVILLGGSFNLLRSLLCSFNNGICLRIERGLHSEFLCFIASQAMSSDTFIFSSSGRDLICCSAWLFPPRTSWVLLYQSTQVRWGIISNPPNAPRLQQKLVFTSKVPCDSAGFKAASIAQQP